MDRRGHARRVDLRGRRGPPPPGLREVIARCLYGADINPMAVEMCKLSLWLVSMDKTKPFSFVDDKVFCGNSLLGLTSLDQLRYLHIDPKPSTMQQQILVDIDAKIADRDPAAARAGQPGRGARPDAVVASQDSDSWSSSARRPLTCGSSQTGSSLQGCRSAASLGRQLDDAFKALSWQLQEAFPADGSAGDSDEAARPDQRRG